MRERTRLDASRPMLSIGLERRRDRPTELISANIRRPCRQDRPWQLRAREPPRFWANVNAWLALRVPPVKLLATEKARRLIRKGTPSAITEFKQHHASEIRWVDLGAGAGMEETACDGLSRFKPFHARFSRTLCRDSRWFLGPVSSTDC